MSEVVTIDVCAYGEVVEREGKGRYVYTEDYRELERELQEAKDQQERSLDAIDELLEELHGTNWMYEDIFDYASIVNIIPTEREKILWDMARARKVRERQR